MVKISLVILNYNGKELLKVALDSIKKIRHDSYEVIVVDNASSDGSVEFVRKNYPSARIIRNSANTGYPAVNLAVPKSRGEYFLYLNNDMELAPDCLKEMQKALEKDEDTALVVPKLVNYYDRKAFSAGTWISRCFYSGYSDKKNDKKKIIPYGCGMIRKSVIKKMPYLFDPDYFLYGEDVDLGVRIRLLGLNTLYVPSAVIYHMERQTTSKVATSARLVFLMERNMLTTYLKNLSVSSIIILFPYVLSMRLIALLRDLVKFDFKAMISRAKALAWIAGHMPLIIRKRREIQKIRRAADGYVLAAFDEKPFLRRFLPFIK